MIQAQEIPIACTLSATELQTRTADLQTTLFSGSLAAQPTSHGYRFDFPATADWLEKIASFINFERQCCAFLSFELAVLAQQEKVSLHIYGGEGVKEFIASELLLAE